MVLDKKSPNIIIIQPDGKINICKNSIHPIVVDIFKPKPKNVNLMVAPEKN